jgi:hypothetical protein
MFNSPEKKLIARAPRGQIRCWQCKRMCTPKLGDWYHSKENSGQQFFLCAVCGPSSPSKFKRAVAPQN